MITDSNTYVEQGIVWLVLSINKESLQGNHQKIKNDDRHHDWSL